MRTLQSFITAVAALLMCANISAQPNNAPPELDVNVINQPLATQSSKVPVQDFLPFVFGNGDVAASPDEPYEVPEGLRLVIEYVDVHITSAACQFDLFARISTYANGFLQGTWLPVAPSYQGTGAFYRNHASAPFKKYADPGSPVRLLLNRNNSTCSAIGSFNFSGYLEEDL